MGKGKHYNTDGKNNNQLRKANDEVFNYFNKEHYRKANNINDKKTTTTTSNNSSNKTRNDILGALLYERVYNDRIEIEENNNNKRIKQKTIDIYDDLLYSIELSIGKNKLNTLSHLSLQKIAKHLNDYDINELNQFFNTFILALPVVSLLLYWGCRYNTINDDTINIITLLSSNNVYRLNNLIFGATISSDGIRNVFNKIIEKIVIETEQDEWLLLLDGNLTMDQYLPIRILSLVSSSCDINTFTYMTQYISNVITIKLHNVFNSIKVIKTTTNDSFIDDKHEGRYECNINAILLIISSFIKLETLDISYCNWVSITTLQELNSILRSDGKHKLNIINVEGCYLHNDNNDREIENLIRSYHEIGIELNIKK